MIDPVNLIHFDLEVAAPRIIFQASYRPTTGPLPRLEYPLIGLWVYNSTVVRALFKAPAIPTHEREPILHRYEGATHQGQAKYRYFTVPGHAGMVLTKKGFEAANIRVNQMWASLSESHNHQEWRNWANAHNASRSEDDPVLTTVRIEDMLHGLPPIILCITPTKERSIDPDAQVERIPEGPPAPRPDTPPTA